MIDFIVAHLDVVLSFVLGILAYAYKKGREDNKNETKDRRAYTDTSLLQKQLKDTQEELHELKNIVNKIEQALDRSYATTKYVHDTFPSREVFDIKMEAVQEHITNKIESVVQMLKLQKDIK